MQTLVVLFLLFTVCVANDGDVYVYNEFNNYKNNLGATENSDLFRFGYHLDDMLKMSIFLRNKPEDVGVVAYLKYPKGYSGNYTGKIKYEAIGKDKYFEIRHKMTALKITIELDLSTNSDVCTSKEIVKAERLARGPQNDKKYYDICLKDEPCVVEVDLSRIECKDNTPNPFSPTKIDKVITTNGIETSNSEYITPTMTTIDDVKQPTSESNVLVYVISPMIVTCVVILVIYISVKKYRHRNSQRAGAIELNTYPTASEVVYADLSLAHGNNPPPRSEETPYARIIGVMKPVT